MAPSHTDIDWNWSAIPLEDNESKVPAGNMDSENSGIPSHQLANLNSVLDSLTTRLYDGEAELRKTTQLVSQYHPPSHVIPKLSIAKQKYLWSTPAPLQARHDRRITCPPSLPFLHLYPKPRRHPKCSARIKAHKARALMAAGSAFTRAGRGEGGGNGQWRGN